jgi:hypothetical protein
MRIDRPNLPPPRRRPWMALLNAVIELAGNEAELLRHAEHPWASVTFAGSRHTIALVFRGETAIDAAEDFIVALPDHEFVIPGQIVIEAAITGADHALLPEAVLTLELELLLLEEA